MSPRRFTRSLAVTVAGLLVLAGCSNDADDQPAVAAVVEGADIASAETENLVDTYLNRQALEEDEQTSRNREVIAKIVLAYQIEITFLEQLAKQRGIETGADSQFEEAAGAVDPETFQAVGLRSEDFVRTLRAGALSKAIAAQVFPDVSISEAAITEEFERRRSTFERAYKAKVKIAQFATEQPAGMVREKVAAGEAFEVVATGLGSIRVDSVEIDPITDDLPADLLDAVAATNPGEVTAAVQVASGWLAVLVEERQDLPAPTLEDLRADLTEILSELERAQLFNDWFDKQFKKAKVEVDGFYGEWDAESVAVL